MRSGKIEFNRFMFCVFILIFHFDKYYLGLEKFSNVDFEFTKCAHGAMGVEFFFLVSGFLMAKKAYKNYKQAGTIDGSRLSNETLSFMWGKYKAIFPYHVVAFIMLVIIKFLVEKPELGKGIRMLFGSIPNFLLIEMSGFGSVGINPIEWYISAMLLCMFIIYPIIRTHYDMFVKVIGPILAIFILGYMYYTTKGLTGVKQWMGVGYKSVFRAFAELSLGCTAYEICRIISEKKREISVQTKVLLTCIEALCYAFTIEFIVSNLPREYEFYALITLFVGVTLSFSEVTYGNKMFQNKFFFFLGKATLPMYLCQLSAITIVLKYCVDYSFKMKLIFSFGLLICFSSICYAIGSLFMKKKVKKGDIHEK